MTDVQSATSFDGLTTVEGVMIGKIMMRLEDGVGNSRCKTSICQTSNVDEQTALNESLQIFCWQA